MFSKKFIGGAALTALGVALASQAGAQETTSALRGEVTSTNGQPIANARVVITHQPTGTRREATTNADGVFDQRGLNVGGPYIIEFAAPQFRGERIEGLSLALGDPTRLVVDLEPATAGEVVVTAQRRQLVGGASSSTILNRGDIAAIVSVNRDIRDLARRDPLVSQGNISNQGISIAGSNPRTNRITIDGVQAQDDFGLNTGGLPTRRGPVSLDAISQFQVEAVPFDVENGDFLGGAINVVLAQGENDFDGSLFVNYLNEGLVGQEIAGQTRRRLVTQDNWGGSLRGPIIPNRAFFALSYENFETSDVTDRGVGGGFANNITGPATNSATIVPMTPADIAAVTNVFANTYGSTFAFGTIPITKPITDEKTTARFDLNLTDDHKLTLTYRLSESGLIQRTNLGQTSAGLDSQWYLTGEEDQTVSGQLNSNWTDALSTEIRYSRRNYTRLQEPPSGQKFSDVRVCSTLTPLDAAGQSNPTLNCRNGATTVGVVRFGPDQFRHANFLETQNDQFQASAELALGRHVFKAGVQSQYTDIFNLFVPNSDGTYYFDSVADFTAGRASELIYRNALTGNDKDAAASFGYGVASAFVQDTWDILDTLTLTYGVRIDRYVGEDVPARNNAFATRYGFSNQTTYDGLDVIMPRFAFEVRPSDAIEVSGGVGLFSGGLPDVFISNSFSNTGVLDNTLTFQRTALGATADVGDDTYVETSGSVNCGAAPSISAICTDALNLVVGPNFGRSIPASVVNALGGSTPSPAAETNSLSPNFEIPSDWRANLNAAVDVAGIRFGVDAVYVRSKDALAFRDLRAQPLLLNGQRARTPDGRLRYDGLTTAQRNAFIALAPTTNTVSTPVGSSIPVGSNGQISSNRDIQAYNPDETNELWTVAFSVSGDFDWGLDFSAAYTIQDIQEFSASARFSSTASSLYGGQFASVDPNTAVLGRGQEEISETIKGEVGFGRAFLFDLESRVSIGAQWFTGKPSTFTMSGGTGRNATFGVNRGAQLAYIPNLTGTQTTSNTAGAFPSGVVGISSDPKVVFSSATELTRLQTLASQLNLRQGAIVDRGSFENDDIFRLDLQFSQELPGVFKTHRTKLTFDFQNFANFLNDEWGVIRTRPEDIRLFDVTCAGPTGNNNDAGVASCDTYRISGVNQNAGVETIESEYSRWFLQVGLRYEF